MGNKVSTDDFSEYEDLRCLHHYRRKDTAISSATLAGA